ncbi:MAG: hypothetical protein IJX08_07600 [Clostridia bacterium]|nr:hypothetical protein [Clostridia bacterium]
MNENREGLAYFLYAFSRQGYSQSMGRGADGALEDFGKLTKEEQAQGVDYILSLISQEPCRVYGRHYLLFVEKWGDSRFIPAIKAHLLFHEEEKPHFSSEIGLARRALAALMLKE